MTKRSRVGAIATALALPLAFALVACAPSAEAPADEAITSDIEATITIWHYNETAGLQDIDPQIAQFEKLYPNVTFEVTFIPEEQFPNRIISAATSQDGPDIMWYNGAFTKTFAEAGVIGDISEEWAGFEDASLFPDSVLQTFNDSIYGVQSYVNLNALYYNQTILDEIGVEVPTNLDELEDAMRAATAAGYRGMMLPGSPGVAGEWVSKAFFTGYGVQNFADYADPGVEEVFTRVTGWVDEGLVPKATVTLQQADAVNEFVAGDVAFYVGGNWQLTLPVDAGFDWGVTPMPAGPNGPAIVYLGGQAEALGAFASNKALAWEFLKQTWLTKEHGTMRLGLGSIPTRSDVLEGDVDPNVQAFADAAANGTPLSSDTASTLAIGDLWSGVLAGQVSPTDGAAQAAQIAAGAE